MRRFALLAVLVAIVGCRTPASPGTAFPSSSAVRDSPSPVGVPVDHAVLTFSGSDYATTPPFTIPSPDWTLDWSLTGNAQYGYATFTVNSAPGGNWASSTVVDTFHAQYGSLAVTVQHGNGVFFIDISPGNVAYTITVTASYPGPDQLFSLPAETNLAVYTGTGDKTTPTFHVTGSLWVIAVHAGQTPHYTPVDAYVTGATDNKVVSVAGVQTGYGGTDTTSYVYAGPGDYYVKVVATNAAWTVTIQQSNP